MGISEKIAHGLFWAYAERVLAQGVSLVVSIILARVLSPEYYGSIAIVQIFITICNALAVGGFGNALVQKKNATSTDFNSACIVSVSMAGVLYSILFFASPLLSAVFKDSQLSAVMRVMGIRLVFASYNSVQQAYVQRKMMFRKFFYATLGGTVTSGIVGVVLAYKGAGIWALVAQDLINAIMDGTILYIITDWKLKLEISIKCIRELWSFGSKMLVATLVFTLKDNIRALIIGKEFSPTELAFYNQGKKYPALAVTDIVDSLGKVIFPALSLKQDSRTDIKNIMRKTIRISSFFLTPVIVGLFSVADIFVGVVLTDKWLPCIPYMRILCLVYLTRPISSVFQKGILAIGKSQANLFHEVTTSVSTLVLIGITAFVFKSSILIAWSYVLVMVIGIIIFSVYVNYYFNYKYSEMVSDYFPSLLSSIIMGFLVYGIGRLNLYGVWKLIIQVLAGFAIYLIITGINEDDGFLYIKEKLLRFLRIKPEK